jgi:hypothetical protein
MERTVGGLKLCIGEFEALLILEFTVSGNSGDFACVTG